MCVEYLPCSAAGQKQGAKQSRFCLQSLSGKYKCPSGARIASSLTSSSLLSVRQGSVYFTLELVYFTLELAHSVVSVFSSQ